MAYDLFVSYRRKDAGRVLPLVDLLRQQHGLRVWLDQSGIDSFESTTRSIAVGLSQSRAMLTWHSSAYPESRPCQWELTNGFLAAMRGGDPRHRILIVNPEPDNAHIHPVELRDQNFRQVRTADSQELRATAQAIARRLEMLDSAVLGDLQALVRPHWYGRSPASSNRFVGRLAALWHIHSALHGGEHAIVAKEAIPVVQVRGLGGLGKTLLVEEYALRFGAAFPAGVFWVQAPGLGATDQTLSPEQRNVTREQQLRVLAIELGASEQDFFGPEAIQSVLRARLDALTHRTNSGVQSGQNFLWIVDDLPTEVSRGELDRWVAPHPLGKTLITTRSREYDGLGSVIDLEVLRDDEAVSLLALCRPPLSEQERAAAHAVAKDLGFLPLALDVAGAALKRSAGLMSYQSYREKLANPSKDALEFAGHLAGQLPTGHTASVAGTLLGSIEQLEQQGLDFLRLASQLAPAAIPSNLVARALALTDALDTETGEEQAMLAFQQCEMLSLSECVTADGKPAHRVHALVTRTLRLYDPSAARQLELQSALVRALLEVLPAVCDARLHESLELYVMHSRHLLSGDVDDGLSVDMLGWVARFDLERGYYESAAQLSRRQMLTCERLFGANQGTTLLAMGDLGRALKKMDRRDEAVDLEERVLEGRLHLLGPEHMDTLTAMNNLASSLEDYPRALALHKQVLETRRRVLGPEHEHTLFSIHNYGATLMEYGAYADARPTLEEAYNLRKRLLGPDRADTLVSGYNLGRVLFALGETARAREIMQSIVDIRGRVLGADHPSTLFSKCVLGEILVAQGDLQKAKTLLKDTESESRRRLGNEHATTLMVMNDLGNVLFMQGEIARAREIMQSIVDIRGRVLGADHPSTLFSKCNLGRILIAQGDLQKAKTLLKDTVSDSCRRLGNEHTTTLLAMNNLARALAKLGELEEARPLQEQALAGQRKARGNRDGITARYAFNLFELRLRQGETACAQEVFQGCLRWLLDADSSGLSREQREVRSQILERSDVRRWIDPHSGARSGPDPMS
jgi:tetratricopeptide (TPR) repeat protein